MESNMEKLDPQVYFDLLKDKKNKCTDEFLTDYLNIIEKELTKAMKLKQNFMVRRLAYATAIVPKERELIKQGVDVFVLREDIEEYIKEVADKAVKIIELEMYPRTIPDEVYEKVTKLQEQNLFDRFYIVYTDYTDEGTKNVAEEKRRKDPIIFGAFEQKLDGIWDIFDRFYFIADWEDEYCDLTLSKMVDAMSKKKDKDIVHDLAIPKADEETVRSYLHALNEAERNRFTLRPQKKSFFQKVKTAWKELLS